MRSGSKAKLNDDITYFSGVIIQRPYYRCLANHKITQIFTRNCGPENPVVNETIIFNASLSYDPDGNITAYEWEFGDGATGTGEIVNHSYSSPGNYTVNLTVTDDDGAKNSTSKIVNVMEKVIFDTGEGTYPSIFGTHNGTITPYKDIHVERMFTYPCAGTGGHSESFWVHGNGLNESASWTGYTGDWHNITFGEAFVLKANVSYN